MRSHVRLRHPVTGGVWLCPVGAVEAWTRKGWRRDDPARSAPKEKKGGTNG